MVHNCGMTKAQAIQLAGSGSELARLLGITPVAITRWKDGPIPQAREWQLRLIKPEWFYASKEKK